MNLEPFLAATSIIDWQDDGIREKAERLAVAHDDPIDVIRSCFHFVRDEIRHSVDFQCGPVTCRASDVLRHGTGYCYAKSHLLAALLRANGIPSALCYQRLRVDGPETPFCLHGLNAVWTGKFGWMRLDARGNKPGVNAGFEPPRERLAFVLTHPGERDLPGYFAEPLPVIVEALRREPSWQSLLANLPDWNP